MFRTLLFSAAFIICFSFPSFGQQMQLGLNGGLAFYQGDLQTVTGFNRESVGELGYSAGAFARFEHKGILATRLGLQYGFISAADANSNDPGRRSRNLSFQSNLFELSLIEEIHLLPLNPRKGLIFSPYLAVGIGVVYFNPKTEYQGDLVELQPLGTEGQGMPGFDEKYSLLQLAIPIAGGVKLALGESTTLNIEFGARKLFTDYLDDVSGSYVSDRELTAGNGILSAELAYRLDEINGMPNEFETGERARGSSEFDDWYYFMTIGIAFDIDAGLLFGGQAGEGCPSW